MSAFPAYIWIMFAVAAVISAIGFFKFIYFISIGYGFSISGLGIAMLALYGICKKSLTAGTVAACIVFIVYGLRLGGYLLLRELKSKNYNKFMKTEIKNNDDYPFFVTVAIWVACIILYVAEVSPVFYRLANGDGTDAMTWIGVIIMVCGIVLESTADKQKSAAKKLNPKRWCDTGLFKMVRCPNYLGEVVFWTGVLLSGVTGMHTVGQWIMALVGYVGIVYIMWSGCRRLEIRQNKNYGSDPEYQKYVKTTPIMIPLLPIYSVERFKWLVG